MLGEYQGTMRDIELLLNEGRLFADIRFRGGLPSDRELADMPPAAVARCGPDELLVLDGALQGHARRFPAATRRQRDSLSALRLAV